MESLLGEAIAGLEIIVVDDGSTDDGLAAIEGLAVRVLRQRHLGEAAARNAGVRTATAPFVTFLDADDIMNPGALSARLDFLLSHPEESVVGGLPSRLIDPHGRVLAEVFSRMASQYSFPFRLKESFYRAGRFFPVSCSLYLYRREVFDRIGLYDETLPVAPDCDFHFRLLRSMEIPILKCPVFDRRIHERNLSLTSTGAGVPSFRPEVLETVREVNRRFGFAPQEVRPWELDYL